MERISLEGGMMVKAWNISHSRFFFKVETTYNVRFEVFSNNSVSKYDCKPSKVTTKRSYSSEVKTNKKSLRQKYWDKDNGEIKTEQLKSFFSRSFNMSLHVFHFGCLSLCHSFCCPTLCYFLYCIFYFHFCCLSFSDFFCCGFFYLYFSLLFSVICNSCLLL